ncbi:MAG: butyrate kinase [Dethiosulfatibacter sp.]|nr:butyrate kinase [Dethiosulfatibacter sp.]
MKKRILAINLGSTSTKIAVYENLDEKLKKSINHSNEELSRYSNFWEQTEFRKNKIIEEMLKSEISFSSLDVIASRGGLFKPIPGGIYQVNDDMIDDMKSEKYGIHPASIGCVIAYELGKEHNISVITADTPVTDEFCTFARYSGMKEIPRASAFHALNQKRTARVVAERLNRKYEDLNLIVVHLGGGISVAAHEKGLVIDVNNALDGDGPFSPERAGTVPVGDLIKLCFSGKYSEKEMLKKIQGDGGLMSYLGTNSGLEVEERIRSGDQYALEVFEAMAYQVSKEIASMAAVLKGNVDAIVLTGSLAYSNRLINWIKERVGFIAEIHLNPGENEMLSLAENALRFLEGEKPKKY